MTTTLDSPLTTMMDLMADTRCGPAEALGDLAEGAEVLRPTRVTSP